MGMQRFALHALCGMIRVYARVEAAMAAAQSRVPWATIVVRKMFGVAASVHVSPQSTILLWPSAEVVLFCAQICYNLALQVGPLPVEGGVEVAFGRAISQAENPQQMRRALEAKLALRYTCNVCYLY